MCQEFSGLWTINGQLVMHDLSDSHEFLIELADLTDDGAERFVRLEYIPGNDPFAFGEYKLRIDKERPGWFDNDQEMAARRAMADWLASRVTDTDIDYVVGRLVFARGKTRLYRVYFSRVLLHGNAQATLYHNTQATLHDNAQATLYGNTQATLHGNAQATLYHNAQARACTCGCYNGQIVRGDK